MLHVAYGRTYATPSNANSRGDSLTAKLEHCLEVTFRPSFYTTSARHRQNALHFHTETGPTATDFLVSKPTLKIENPQTLVEKIVQRYAVGLAPGKKVRAGEYVTIKPAACMTHDNSFPVAKKFMGLGAEKIRDPSMVVFTINHDVQNRSPQNLEIEFAKKHGIDFYGAGRGTGHQVMVEEGYAWPGTMAVASDSHSNVYGRISCLGTPAVRTDAASIWATGPGVGVLTFARLPIDARLTISNMSTEHGALSAMFPIAATLEAWLRARATVSAMMSPDSKAHSRLSHERIDSLFENPKVLTPLKDLEAQDIKIDKAYLVSCTKSRASDIAAAARVFREAAKNGQPAKTAPGVKFYLAAASSLVQEAAEEAGDWQVLHEAGAELPPAGCGPCIGLGTGLLEPGEVGISASNRSFKGRMGFTKAKAHRASPEKPEGFDKVILGAGVGNITADIATSIEDALEKLISQADSIIAESEKGLSGAPARDTAAAEGEETLTEILPGFPEKICMENYDPSFRDIAKAGDILVSGFNFGTGSSREQAAMAILAKKIPVVMAGSFGNIFSGNSINNALMGVEVPKLVQRLRETFKGEGDDKVLTRRTGWKLKWDVRRSKVTITEKGGETWSVRVGELPPNVQEIIACGPGQWVKADIRKESANN
ncbi:uncharacterized protein LY79DRAFT_586155 [Colletotrichum navitas]|uniref:Homoaconitate hydratase n=1 Tax=Colletotrichum navitas TaxID=681940 RepID=A0AAD8QB31_9PEZI|nr:uncharacterized protein LY79DRAFT_586155 [Colletotrichum navitas]KAK1599393.1 hypothetical protein LY79DRAFT_586155 [Colletotrichum navitas]